MYTGYKAKTKEISMKNKSERGFYLKTVLLMTVLAVVMFISCSGSTSEDLPISTEVTFIKLTANGSTAATTTKLTLTFSNDITDLVSGDITFASGNTGTTKGTLTQTRTGVYELAVSGITASGQVTVTVSKTGYTINNNSRTVQVYYYADSQDIAVWFNSLTANGSTTTATTNKLTLIFDKNIINLAATDITITPNTVIKGALTRTGTGVYELAVSGITANGQVTVTVNKNGYAISGSSRKAQVYYYADSQDIAVWFNNLTANGSTTTATTTKLTLTFDNDITNLMATDITLTPNSIAKGALTKTGTGVYELAVSGITANGQVTVAVTKSGYTISDSPRTVQVYYYAASQNIAVSFSNLTADGSSTAATTKLILTFDKDITGLAASDITLTPGSTGTTKGTLTKTAGETGKYELTVSGITASGQVTVAVTKSGYTISGSPQKTVQVYYVASSDIGIGIGEPSIKLYLNGSASSLQEGGSTLMNQGEETYTVSIASGTYTGITWYVNGNVAPQGSSRTSLTLYQRIPGAYLITVEASPAGGEKNTGSHSFIVQ
jgi:hypothetical protein